MEKQAEKKGINCYEFLECPFCFKGLAKCHVYPQKGTAYKKAHNHYMMKCYNCGAHGAIHDDEFTAYIRWAQLSFTFPVPKILMAEIIHQDMQDQPQSFNAVRQCMLNIKSNFKMEKKYQLFLHGLARALRYYRDHLMDWSVEGIQENKKMEKPDKLKQIENYCESFFDPDYGGEKNEVYREICKDILSIIHKR